MAWRGRYIILVFDCLLVVGIYFCTDIPSALQTHIEGTQTENCTENANTTCCEDCLGLGADKYNLLYTIMSWTSSLMILPVGFVIDRMGNRVSALVFTGIATSGSFLFAAGSLPAIRGTSAMFPVMMIGRLLLGAGTGSSRIVRDRVIACWFPDKLSLAFGIAVSTMGLGSVLTFVLTSNLAQWIGLGPTLFVGAGVCSTCFVSAICLCIVDKYGSEKQGGSKIKLREKSENILTTIRKLPMAFWVVCVMTATYYSFQLPFTGNASKFIQQRYGYQKTTSSYINGVIYDVSVVLSPFVGLVLDKFGNRGWMAFIGALLTIPAGPVLLFTDISPLAVQIWIGVMFTITVVSLWSTIPHVVPPMALGAANGIASCMLDLTVGITSLCVGQIMSSESESNDGSTSQTVWRHVFLLLFSLVTLCSVCGLILNVCCRKDGKVNEIVQKSKRLALGRERSLAHSLGPIHCSPIPTPMPDKDTDTPRTNHFTFDDVVIENYADKEWKRFSNYKATHPNRKSDSSGKFANNNDTHITTKLDTPIELTKDVFVIDTKDKATELDGKDNKAYESADTFLHDEIVNQLVLENELSYEEERQP